MVAAEEGREHVDEKMIKKIMRKKKKKKKVAFSLLGNENLYFLSFRTCCHHKKKIKIVKQFIFFRLLLFSRSYSRMGVHAPCTLSFQDNFYLLFLSLKILFYLMWPSIFHDCLIIIIIIMDVVRAESRGVVWCAAMLRLHALPCFALMWGNAVCRNQR